MLTHTPPQQKYIFSSQNFKLPVLGVSFFRWHVRLASSISLLLTAVAMCMRSSDRSVARVFSFGAFSAVPAMYIALSGRRRVSTLLPLLKHTPSLNSSLFDWLLSFSVAVAKLRYARGVEKARFPSELHDAMASLDVAEAHLAAQRLLHPVAS